MERRKKENIMTEFEKNLILSKLEKLFELFENLQKQVDALEISQENAV